ncbi:MAG: GDP-mannose 4,6-dehydratase [Candidatus Woesearchaeota archaeon]|jgi:CDP-glucose 4,6-dehydratase|nr:GDP-mannose 4,6-dehydratase [Candidatus Woesearchaeota archaeon]
MTFWEGKNVLITGANGFIGSYVTKALVDKGANVTALIRDKIPNSNLILSGTANKINLIEGCLTDIDVIKRALNEYEIDTIFHLAAQAIVTTANRSPLSTFESNIKGTWNVLEACRLHELTKRVVIASSDKAYGDQEKLPYTEESPLLGLYPYDASKACADILSQSYHKTYKLPVAITRLANTYGGGDLNFSRIIPDTIRAIINNKAPIIRSDGTPVRDYMYVEDAASAYITLAENLDNEEVVGKGFNFGTNTPVSVIELVNKMLKAANSELKPVIQGTAKSEIDKQYLDSSKVKRIMGWEPKFSLDEGLKATIEWYNQNLTKIEK